MPLGALTLLEAITSLWLGLAAIIDGCTRRIPNGLVVGGLIGIIALRIVLQLETTSLAAATAFLGSAVLLVLRSIGIWWRGQPGIGMGDVKLALVLGLGFGPPALIILWAGCMLAGLYGLVGLITRRLRRDARLPLVPFLFAAAVLYVSLRSIGALPLP